MATTKQVVVLARYAHKTNGKLNGTVTYLVKSSDGKSQYCTTLVDGKASGCSCPAKSRCYHKTQLEAKEQDRKVATQFAAKALPVWAIELVKAGKLVAKVAPEKPKVAVLFTEKGPRRRNRYVTELIEAQEHKSGVLAEMRDIAERGNLNGQRAFSLMR